MNRRSFFRVAVLGGAGAATIAACPEIIEQAVSKTYCFLGDAPPSILALVEARLAQAAANMAEMLATDIYLSNLTVKAPGYTRIVRSKTFEFGYMAKEYKASVAMPSDPTKWLVDLT